MDYSRGKVYGLAYLGRVVYVGSTVQTLQARLAGHKKRARACPQRKIYAFFAEVGADNIDIVLLGALPCATKDELLAEERRIMLLHRTHLEGCNLRVAGGRQDGGWKARNRERHLAYCREWNAGRRTRGRVQSV